MSAHTFSQSRGPLVAIGLVSLAACGFLFWLLYVREVDAGAHRLSFLPVVNAMMNGCASVCLVAGWQAIRRKAQAEHRLWMVSAFVFSSLFLVGYIVHHAVNGDTKFAGEGWIRSGYLLLLASHVVLSIVALPMVLSTFFFSLTGQLDRHRRLARWTLPIWLYVSATGVLVFAMLKNFSPS